VNPVLNILYRDDDVVAVNKPEGLAAVPEHSHDPTCLAAQVAALLGVRVWPVHRLDKGVSGVILYALHADAHRILNTRFEQREVRKTYAALAWGRVAADRGTVDQPLREFGSGRMGVDPVGKPSVTDYAVRERLETFTLLDVLPRTGRRHQIRVHLYALGHPIIGDPRYGDPVAQRPFARLMLHACAIKLILPSGRPLDLHDCPSATFDAELARCRAMTA